MFKTDLYPAQLLFLRKPSKVSVAEIFAIVFQDLVIRQVLNLHKLKEFPTERSKKGQNYYMLTKGRLFEGYEAQNFETSIITAFDEHEKLQLKTITNSILKHYGLPSSYITEEIMGPLKKDGLISAVPFLSAFGMKKASGNAITILKDLNTYLKEKQEQLSECLDKDRERVINLLKELNSLVFFIKKDNPELYNSILENTLWIYRNKPFGIENDLSEFIGAMQVDTSYLEAH